MSLFSRKTSKFILSGLLLLGGARLVTAPQAEKPAPVPGAGRISACQAAQAQNADLRDEGIDVTTKDPVRKLADGKTVPIGTLLVQNIIGCNKDGLDTQYYTKRALGRLTPEARIAACDQMDASVAAASDSQTAVPASVMEKKDVCETVDRTTGAFFRQ